MAQRKKSEYEFIQDSFSPQVAVSCSYDAEMICRKNNLTFVELVQPFSRFNSEVRISDPSNNFAIIKNFKVDIKDVNYIAPQTSATKNVLEKIVSSEIKSTNVYEKNFEGINYSITTNISTPWYESWRDNFIKLNIPGDHEFLNNFLACVFVVSTSHLDPLDQFQKLLLQQQTQATQNTNRSIRWFFPNFSNVYKYFVLLHDVQEGEISKAHLIYETLKNTYGSSNCHLLQINSKPITGNDSLTNISNEANLANDFDPWLQYCKLNDLHLNNFGSIDSDKISISSIHDLENENDSSSQKDSDTNFHPLSSIENSLILPKEINQPKSKKHGMCLSLSDHDRIKTFFSEFLLRGLVPYTEKTIRILNEQVQSKKSILKGFSLSRKLFGSSSSTTTSSSSTTKSVSSSPIVSLSNASLSITGLDSNLSSPSNLNNGLITITNQFINTNDDYNLRRLADLAFMFRLYDLAYINYHSCKKEFTNYLSNYNSNSQSNNQQFLNMKMALAGSLEMATIASFMQTSQNDQSAISVSSSTSNSLSSLSLSSNAKNVNTQYIEEALQIYMNDCKNIYYSTRCTIFSTDILRACSFHLKSAYQYINLANDEHDIRSSLFLEQAALCFLVQSQPWFRKYAFFMSLAGHRFNKIGQKQHSLRAYKQALQIYSKKSWFKVLDQINYTMSRQNYHLKNLPEALLNIENILFKRSFQSHSNKLSLSKKIHHKHKNDQSILIEFSNELNILKDFLNYHNLIKLEKLNDNPLKLEYPNIYLPIVDLDSISVNLNPVENFLIDSSSRILVNNYNQTLKFEETNTNCLKEIWQQQEESLYYANYRTHIPILFNPQNNYFDKNSDNRHMPKVVVDEFAQISFNMRNVLKINLLICECTLLWKYIDQTCSKTDTDSANTHFEISNLENDDASILENFVESTTINEIIIPSNTQVNLRLLIKPKKCHGHLQILGIKYKLKIENSHLYQEKNPQQKAFSFGLYGKQLFDLKGKRLNNTSQAMRSISYEKDNRLNWKTVQNMPLLQIRISHLPKEVFCNQIDKIKLYLTNLSTECSIKNVKIACNKPNSSFLHFNSIGSNSNSMFSDDLIMIDKIDTKDDSSNFQDTNDCSINKFQKKEIDHESIFSLNEIDIKPKETYELDMYLRASDIIGSDLYYLTFFYEPCIEEPLDKKQSTHNLKYRTIRFSFCIKTFELISKVKTHTISSQISTKFMTNLEITTNKSTEDLKILNSISLSQCWKIMGLKNHFPSNKINKFNAKDNFDETSGPENCMSLVVKLEEIQREVKDKNSTKMFISYNRSKWLNENDVMKSSQTLTGSSLEDTILSMVKKIYRNNPQSIHGSNVFIFLTLYIKWKETDIFILKDISLTNVLKKAKTKAVMQSDQKTVIQTITPKEIFITFNSISINLKKITTKRMFLVEIFIDLKNASDFSTYDLKIVAENDSVDEKTTNFLWLGCNKRYVTVLPKEEKRIQFKLGINSNGVFDISRKMNGEEKTMFIAEKNKNISFESIFLSKTDSNTVLSDNVCPITIFLKDETTKSDILLKRLNAFSIITDFI